MEVVSNLWLLLVEDERDIREALQTLLALEGYHVQAVADLDAARAALRGSSPRWLVLDLMLGNESGESLLEELAQRDDAPPTVLVSASPRARDVAHRYQVEVVRKPFDVDTLIETIRRLGPAHRPSRPQLNQ